MALQSEVSPPMVGDPNKDTQIEGDTKSDDDSSQSTDEDVDLEEGEILDSGEEAEAEEKKEKDLTNSSLQEALGKDFLKDIEQLVSQAKSEIPVPATNIINKNLSPHGSPHKKKRPSKYLDHDKFEDNSDREDGWYSPSRKHKSSKFDAPIDYRKELEAYRGTPPSSPDIKHREKKKKKSSKKSKKSSKKAIKRKDIKGEKVRRYIKEANKFRICKFFKEGNCAKGADCGFSHATPKSFKKKELCKFYLSGHCNKGSDCIYMHGEFPCKFYHTGSECYAKDACRFSHAPLTEETQRILDDYLNINRGDDDYHDHHDHHDRSDRKRRGTPSPEPKVEPPPKRVCLLGSPPRHIREAEETKRWQEEMLMQQQNHPGFKININAQRDGLSPPPFSRPNFYQETLPETPSPKKKRGNPEANLLPMNFNPPLSGYPVPKSLEPSVPSPDDNFIYEEDYLDMEDEPPNIKQEPPDMPDFNWTEMQPMEQNMPTIKKEPFDDTNQPDLDFTSDVKFDETTQFSEMESSVDCNTSSPPNSSEIPAIAIKKEIIEDNEYENSNHEGDKPEEKTPTDVSPVQEPAPPPVVIPSHLPKKQQELFKRIFQHQKKTEMAASASDASNSPKSYDNPDPVVKETEETSEKTTVKTEPSVWYSSEDDDDDDDSIEPLTDVLKKLQKEPPVTQLPSRVEAKPAASLMAMLNKIQQNTLQKNRGVQETQQSEFFKNLLHGNISSNDSLQLPGLNTPFSEPKRPALLPDPQPVIKKEPVNAPKDPRLKNRDPRTLASTVSSINLPKTLEQTPLQTSSSLISSAMKTPTILSTSSVTSEATLHVPYNHRVMYTKPPNYTPYINASQSNPNLLKDPRLRKHLNLQNNENGMEIKRESDSLKSHSKDVPPMPKLLLAYDKNSLNINIFESNPAPKPLSEESQDVKPFCPKIVDPRIRRRESQNSTGSNTPPHLSVENSVPPTNKVLNSFENIKIKEEKMWSPPVLENSWLPPVLEPSVTIKQEVDSDTDDPCRLEIDESPQNSSIKVNEESPPVLKKNTVPTPASHLPRAIADPRMARLHNPLDSRRLRVGSSESSNKTAELSKAHLKQNSPPKEILSDASKASNSAALAEDDSNSAKVLKNIPKKKSEKSEEKKKTVHRNRKSSMDYASPLNSCDDSNSNKGLNYNSYNQRQPRTSAPHISSDSNNSTNLAIPETSSDFLSDNSNLECDNSSDVNLKDMFKTIDPTASPFC